MSELHLRRNLARSYSESSIVKSEDSTLFESRKLGCKLRRVASLSNVFSDSITGNTTSTFLTEYDDSKPTLPKLIPELDLVPLDYTKDSDALKRKKAATPQKKDLYSMLLQRILTKKQPDFTVLIGEEEFNCHLVVLQCYSDIFNNYIPEKIIRLPTEKCSPSSFVLIYKWMIKDHQPYKILTHSNVTNIFKSAQFLRIKELEKHCWAFVENTKIFYEDTAFELYIQAKHRNITEFQEMMVPRIQNFFLILVSSWDWLELDCEDVTRFLSSNHIKINCEMEVFMAAVRWLHCDWDNRKDLKFKVLNCVRFGNMTTRQLVDIRFNPENVLFNELTQHPYIWKQIYEALDLASFKEFTDDDKNDVIRGNPDLDFVEPGERNWTGLDKTYSSYREFLLYLSHLRKKKLKKRSKF